MKFEEQYSEILKNQQTLVTPFDIYYTMRYIIFLNDYKNKPLIGNKNDGECLLKYINPKKRKCSNYRYMKGRHCRCIDNK